MYWCIMVESRDQWDQGSSVYELELKRGFRTLEIILDLKPNAEVPCVTKDQRGIVLQYDEIDPNLVTDKIDSTR